MIIDEIECPYCGTGIDIDDTSDIGEGIIMECEVCDEEFRLKVEYEPRLYVEQTLFVNCEKCGDVFDKEYLSRHPAPKGYNSKSSLCNSCYRGSEFDFGIEKEGE